jgi:hypothetical protein
VWSPDGKKVAFSGLEPEAEEGENREKHEAAAEGKGPGQDANNAPSQATNNAPGPAKDNTPGHADNAPDKGDNSKSTEEKSDVRVVTSIRYKLNGRGFLPDRRTQILCWNVESRK